VSSQSTLPVEPVPSLADGGPPLPEVASALQVLQLLDGYGDAAMTSLHTSVENIAWLSARSIHNWSFNYERMLEFWYSKLVPLKSGMIYDVGAHRGRHTVVLAGLGRPVVAFEPLPMIRAVLQELVGDLTNVTVRADALCNKVGTGTFVVNVTAPEESGIRRRIYNDETSAQVEEIDVSYCRLDDFHPPEMAISFIKIDTEGGEIDILRGSSRVLAENRPVLSVEYGYPGYSQYGHTKAELLTVAQAAGYRVFDIFGYPIEPAHWDGSVDTFAWDYLLIPREDVFIASLLSGLRLQLARSIGLFL
jgi:FkbM family methyltransferase